MRDFICGSEWVGGGISYVCEYHIIDLLIQYYKSDVSHSWMLLVTFVLFGGGERV